MYSSDCVDAAWCVAREYGSTGVREYGRTEGREDGRTGGRDLKSVNACKRTVVLGSRAPSVRTRMIGTQQLPHRFGTPTLSGEPGAASVALPAAASPRIRTWSRA